jgi:hypothetical protein
MQLIIKQERLTDGSHVFNVLVPATCLHATTHADAEALAIKIMTACDVHTVDSVSIKDATQ